VGGAGVARGRTGTSIRAALEDDEAKDSPLDHPLTKCLMSQYLADIAECEAKKAELESTIKAAQPIEDEEEAEDSEKKLSDEEFKELKKALGAAKKKLKLFRADFVKQLGTAIHSLDEYGAREFVLGILRGQLDAILVRYVANHRNQVATIFDYLWDKYRAPLIEIEQQREVNMKTLSTEALPYVKDAKRLGDIYDRARRRYRDGSPEIAKSVGAKVRTLIDEHIVSLGEDPKIPPISILDAKFAAHVEKQVSPRAKASEMEHAARHHIRQHLHEDPVHYGKLSERLEEILKTYGENWEQLALALSVFVGEVERGRKADETGLDPQTQAPFFAILQEERQKHQPVPASDARWLAELTVRLVDTIRGEIDVVGFWKNTHAQGVLRSAVFTFLDDHEIVPFDSADAVADRLLELAKAKHARLVKP
jgi:hypothetical protein